MSSDNWWEDTGPNPAIERDYDKPEGSTQARPATHPALIWGLGTVAALLTLALCGFWGLYLHPGRFGGEESTPTAIIWTVTPSPTATVTPTPPPSEDTPSPTEAIEATPTASPDISIGGYVQVTGTGGYGLNLREGPGTNYPRTDTAAEGETFIVVEGPKSAGSSLWWKIRDPEDEEREWWAIGNYLMPVKQP